jgi:hypothetical protein
LSGGGGGGGGGEGGRHACRPTAFRVMMKCIPAGVLLVGLTALDCSTAFDYLTAFDNLTAGD